MQDIWKNAAHKGPRRNKTPEELMQQPQNFRKIKSVMGVTGSSRPCPVATCRGLRLAYMHKYQDGSFSLVWRCEVCHQESEYGIAEAHTREPVSSAEALS